MAERKPNRKLTDQEVEYMLAKAVVQQVPDIYQQASSAPITPLTVVDEIVPRQFPRQRLRWQRLAAACVLLVLCAGGIFSWLWFSTKAVVSIDVNPSVALSLNRFEYVIDTQAGNTDGAEVLDDVSLKNLKLSTALDALMGAMSRKGYLDDQAQISVFVDGSDDDFNRELYDEITDDLAHLAPDAVTQVGESATAQPDTQQPAEQQTTEQTTEQPSAEQTTEQPATDQTTEQPAEHYRANRRTAAAAVRLHHRGAGQRDRRQPRRCGRCRPYLPQRFARGGRRAAGLRRRVLQRLHRVRL